MLNPGFEYCPWWYSYIRFLLFIYYCFRGFYLVVCWERISIEDGRIGIYISIAFFLCILLYFSP